MSGLGQFFKIATSFQAQLKPIPLFEVSGQEKNDVMHGEIRICVDRIEQSAMMNTEV